MTIRDPLLFTPGPLTTAAATKAAMMHDYGSRDAAFVRCIQAMRRDLLRLAGADPERYTTVLVQGSGTYGLEAVVSSVIPPGGCIAVVENGEYGRRIARMARIHGIKVISIEVPENQAPSQEAIEEALRGQDVSLLAVVHCETSTGLLNPIAICGDVARSYGVPFLVDAMSSFGGIPMDIPALGIDYLVTSANKCLEGVPGFAIVIAEKGRLAQSRGWARTLTLDLHEQVAGLDGNGQFRFTPPTHALLALASALKLLDDEGGISGRYKRYCKNHQMLGSMMNAMGFKAYLPAALQAPIITSFHYPSPDFAFESFYTALAEMGFLIYPGKLSAALTFRIGNIGQLTPEDIASLCDAIQKVTAATL